MAFVAFVDYTLQYSAKYSLVRFADGKGEVVNKKLYGKGSYAKYTNVGPTSSDRPALIITT